MTKQPLPQLKSSSRQETEYVKAVQKGSSAQHVVPSNGGWAVKKVGSTQATKTFATQDKATVFARNLAKKQRTELFVHGRDGKIRDRSSFGRDPFPPKG